MQLCKRRLFNIFATPSNTFCSFNSEPHTFQIVLTGGPCGGKSTALTKVSERLTSLGYRAFVVPELPTLFNQCGAGFIPNMSKTELLTYEASIIKAQISLENSFNLIAKVSQKPSVILCDRGTMDVSAYLATEDWKLLLDMEGWNVVNLRDHRYDAVFHLVTAAIGAEKFYTLNNNIARRETLEEARQLDFRTREAWLGHPLMRIITNEKDFNHKVTKLIDGIMGVIGLPKPKHHERRWFVPEEIGQKLWDSLDFWKKLNYQEFDVVSHYLVSEKPTENALQQPRITKRSQNDENSYSYSVRYEEPGDLSMINISAQRISTRNYLQLLSRVDSKRDPVSKKVCPFFNNLIFIYRKFS